MSGAGDQQTADGVQAMVPRERMSPAARKLRDVYEIRPGAPFYRREFGYYSLDAWREQGMPQDVPREELFDFDPPASHGLGQLGWCEAAFRPGYEEEVLEDRGDHELVRDSAGRHVLYFKGRRDGFMPEYLDHPVKDMKTWEEDVKWRLDPSPPERYADLDTRMDDAKSKAAEGRIIYQNLIGGYMYLRSLIGPEKLLYTFYDAPDLIHECMRAWFDLADAVIARHQEPEEAARVLHRLLDAHPELVCEADGIARALLGEVSFEDIADEVEAAVEAPDLDDLGSRAGRHSWGYTHPTEAAWELLEEAVEPFVEDMKRLAALGLEAEALEICKGIVLGLYRARGETGHDVLEWAEDFPAEAAAGALDDWNAGRSRRRGRKLARRGGRGSRKSRASSPDRNGPDVTGRAFPQDFVDEFVPEWADLVTRAPERRSSG